jgi:integrase
MASIRKRGKRWQVQVRSRAKGAVSKSFHRKVDAERWALEQEVLIQTDQFAKIQTQNMCLKELILAYSEKVTPFKKGAAQEFRRINRLLKEHDLMRTPLPEAHPHVFASFRDKRINDGVRACQYDLVLLRHAWNIARVEWGWPLPDNPVSLIRMPKNNPPRERRLRPGEYEKLRNSAQQSRSWYLWPIVDLAIETAMRRSEILGLEWVNVDMEKQQALLPITKNGRARWVPLSGKAFGHIVRIPRTADRVFPITEVAFRQAWDRLRNRSGITDLTFHDLRHEGISRKFESGMSIPEVMAISGHRTANQLFRYVQLSS